tara:strand:+ start:401 stop:652 length:252 start_codon:yes stop_codon:yes gene_type:complete
MLKMDDDLIVSDEWYGYYRACSNNLKKILEILDNIGDTKFIEGTIFWDSIIDIRDCADIKNPEEIKEMLLRARKLKEKNNVSK